jgi:hypothetical protein
VPAVATRRRVHPTDDSVTGAVGLSIVAPALGLPRSQALICAESVAGHGTGSFGQAVVGGGTNLRAAGATAPAGELDRVEEWMDMLARAGRLGCTGFTAAPFTCPREAAHARV